MQKATAARKQPPQVFLFGVKSGQEYASISSA